MISKKEYFMSELHHDFFKKMSLDRQDYRPYLLDRIENILDRCLNNSLCIQNINDLNKIIIWLDWAKTTQEKHSSLSFSTVKDILKKAYKTIFLFFHTLHVEINADLSFLNQLQIFIEPEDPIWASILLHILINKNEKTNFEDILERFPESYWEGMQNITCAPHIAEILQQTIQTGIILPCIMRGRVDVLKFFLNQKVDIDIRDEKRSYLGDIAVIQAKQSKVVQFLIKEGFSLNAMRENPIETFKKKYPEIDLLAFDMIFNPNDDEISKMLLDHFMETKWGKEDYFDDKYLSSLLTYCFRFTELIIGCKAARIFEYIAQTYNKKLSYSFLRYLLTQACLNMDEKKFLTIVSFSEKIFKKLHKPTTFYSAILSLLVYYDDKRLYGLKNFINLNDPHFIHRLNDEYRLFIQTEGGFDKREEPFQRLIQLLPPETWKNMPISSVPDISQHWYSDHKCMSFQYKNWDIQLIPKENEDYLKGKELFNRTLIANLGEKEGECSFLVGSKKITCCYTGFPTSSLYLYKVLKKGYLEACNKGELNQDEEIIEFLDSSMINDPHQILSHILTGKPCCYTSGCLKHSIQIFMFDPFFVICETGNFFNESAFKIFRMNKNKFTLDWLHKLHLQKLNGNSEQMVQLLKELLIDLECQEDPVLTTICMLPNSFSLFQKVGNCTWKSKISCFFISSVLKNLKKIVSNEEWKGEKQLTEKTCSMLAPILFEARTVAYRSTSKGLIRFLEKEVETILQGSHLKPDWKFLFEVLTSMPMSIRSQDHSIYDNYLVTILENCPIHQMQAIITDHIKPLCFEDREVFLNLFTAFSIYLKKQFSKENITNISEVVTKERSLVKVILECCPKETVDIENETLPSPFQLAQLLLDDELIQTLSKRRVTFTELEEDLLKAYEKKDKYAVFELLKRYSHRIYQFIIYRDLIQDSPDLKFFISLLLDSEIQLKNKNAEYSEMLCMSFYFENLLPTFSEEIEKCILKDSHQYNILKDSLIIFLTIQIPGTEEKESLIHFQKEVLEKRELIFSLFNLYPQCWNEFDQSSLSSLELAIILEEELLVSNFLAKEGLYCYEKALSLALELGKEKIIELLKKFTSN